MELSDVVIDRASADDGDKQPLTGKARPSASATAKNSKATASPAAAGSPRSLPAAQSDTGQSDHQSGSFAEHDNLQCSREQRCEDDERPWYKHQSVVIALFTSACGAFLFSGIDEVWACWPWLT